jgi:hypothetical protein
MTGHLQPPFVDCDRDSVAPITRPRWAHSGAPSELSAIPKNKYTPPAQLVLVASVVLLLCGWTAHTHQETLSILSSLSVIQPPRYSSAY